MSFKRVYLTEQKLRELLKSLNIQIEAETHKDFICFCPFHHNTDSPAFAINYNPPYLWKCNNAMCGKTGNIYTLLTQKGYTFGEAEKILHSGFIEPNDFLELIENLLTEIKQEENQWADIDWNQFIIGDQEDDYPARTYVFDRGISLEAYSYFRLGYSRAKHRVVIPVRDDIGILVGLIGRSIDHKSYQYSKSLKRHRVVWNLCNVLKMNTNTLILCEGAFDAISLWDAGHKNVGAIFGSSMSEYQYKLIRSYNFFEVLCFFDNDAAGYAATDSVIQNFPDLMVSYVEYPERLVELADGSTRPPKDPGELSVDEINQMILSRKTKYTRLWQTSN